MALINCVECNREISDKAEICPHCGYPLAKLNKKKLGQVKQQKEEKLIYTDPRFPKLPVDLGIGQPLSKYTSEFNCTAFRKWDDDYDINFVGTTNLKLTIHSKGLLITEIIDTKSLSTKPKELRIHFDALISLKQTNLLQIKEYDASNYTEQKLEDCLLVNGHNYENVRTSSKFLFDAMKNEWQNTKMLVINYWDVEYKYCTSLILRGRYSRFLRFIESFNKAKSNFVAGTPNIPDKKGDNRFIAFNLIRAIILALLFVVLLQYFFS